MHLLSQKAIPTIIKRERNCTKGERKQRQKSWREDFHSPRPINMAQDNKGTYFGGDPVRDIGLHCTDMLLGIIHGDKEISGLAIDVVIKLKSVEKGR